MLDSNYSELLRILGNSGGDTSIKYDSPYSIALAILEANGVDTSTKHYDSLYSILEEIEEMGGGQEEKFTFTINPTPSDAEVSINGSIGNSYEALGGEEIDWEVSKTGYTSQEGEYIMRRDDYSVNVVLEVAQFTFTINTDSNNTVIINGVERSSITADYGTAISWSVSRTGYVTQSGSTTLTEDHTENVTLVLQQFTFTIVPTPADATVVINNVERSSITADYGTAISWEVSKEDYESATGSLTLTSDVTENVTIEEVSDDLTFEVVTPGNIVWLSYKGGYDWNHKTIEYKKNSGSWTSITSTEAGTEIPVVAGDKVKFRGNNTSYCVYNGLWNGAKFSQSDGATFYVYGDLCKLISESSRDSLPQNALKNIFLGCTGILSHPTKDLIISASTLGISSLENAFQSCTSITRPAVIMATATLELCCQRMYYGCSSLLTACKLPIANPGVRSYVDMFWGCTSLQSAPFINCSSTPAGVGILANTFTNCSSLNYIKCLDLTSQTEVNHRYEWVSGVAASGTFVKHPDATYDYGDYVWNRNSPRQNIPNGWTVVDASNIKFNVNVLDAIITVNGNVISGDRYFGELGESVNYTISKTGYQTVSGTTTMPAAEGTTVDITVSMRQNGVDNDYFNMEVVTPGNIKFMMDSSIPSDVTRTLEYSTDNGSTWNQATISDANRSVSIPVAAGDIILWRGTQPYVHGVEGYEQMKLGFNADNGATFYAYGNADALIVDDNQQYSYRFAQLFGYCNGLLSHPTKKIIVNTHSDGWGTYAYSFTQCEGLTTCPIRIESDQVGGNEFNNAFSHCSNMTTPCELPATTFTQQNCYHSMFAYSGITSVPNLPSTDLRTGDYEYMFYYCTGLTNIPTNLLPATDIKVESYGYMFAGCSNLQNVPNLPALNIGQRSYQCMFEDCSSITSVPSNLLPATVVPTEAYLGMFRGCVSLTNAPLLNSVDVSKNAYSYMFNNTAITGATVLTMPGGVTDGMFDNISTTGTLIKHPMADWTGKIPSGWTTQNYSGTTYTVTFSVDQADATIEVNGVVLSGTTYTALAGEKLDYLVYKKGYEIEAGSINVSSAQTVTVNMTVDTSSNDYLSFYTPNNIYIYVYASDNAVDFDYSYDETNWTSVHIDQWSSGGPIWLDDNIGRGRKVFFRGNNTVWSSSSQGTEISINDNGNGYKCFVSGPVTSLLDSAYQQNLGDYEFSNLFSYEQCLYSNPVKDLILPTTTLSEGAYFNLFTNTPGINRVVCLAEDITAPQCTVSWLIGCPAGTFYKKSGVNIWQQVNEYAAGYVPSGWTIVDYVENTGGNSGGGSQEPDIPPTGED